MKKKKEPDKELTEEEHKAAQNAAFEKRILTLKNKLKGKKDLTAAAKKSRQRWKMRKYRRKKERSDAIDRSVEASANEAIDLKIVANNADLASPVPTLKPRVTICLMLDVNGLGSNEIARAMGVNLTTVYRWKRSIAYKRALDTIREGLWTDVMQRIQSSYLTANSVLSYHMVRYREDPDNSQKAAATVFKTSTKLFEKAHAQEKDVENWSDEKLQAEIVRLKKEVLAEEEAKTFICDAEFKKIERAAAGEKSHELEGPKS